MSESLLPVEVLEVIFEDLISEYTKGPNERKLLPRWYLVPLLRVCRLWHILSERLLYRSISVGSRFPDGQTRIIGGRSVAAATRKAYKIARDLLCALEANSRAAAMVEGLRLGGRCTASWTQIKVSLIEISPNLRHVDLRKIQSSELDRLSKALMTKSLVSFRISLLASSELISFPIYDLMQRWPRIQTIGVEGNYSLRLTGRTFNSQASDGTNCCPELREIMLKSGNLHEGDLRFLRLMCSGVTKLGVYVAGLDYAAFDELCACLQTWSPNFEWLSLYVRASSSSYHPLSETLASLRCLKGLQVCNFSVDFGAISSLPQLKRLHHTSLRTNALMGSLASYLEDPAKFNSLSVIVINDVYGRIGSNSGDPGSNSGNLRDVCRRRGIKLWLPNAE